MEHAFLCYLVDIVVLQVLPSWTTGILCKCTSLAKSLELLHKCNTQAFKMYGS